MTYALTIPLKRNGQWLSIGTPIAEDDVDFDRLRRIGVLSQMVATRDPAPATETEKPAPRAKAVKA